MWSSGRSSPVVSSGIAKDSISPALNCGPRSSRPSSIRLQPTASDTFSSATSSTPPRRPESVRGEVLGVGDAVGEDRHLQPRRDRLAEVHVAPAERRRRPQATPRRIDRAGHDDAAADQALPVEAGVVDQRVQRAGGLVQHRPRVVEGFEAQVPARERRRVGEVRHHHVLAEDVDRDACDEAPRGLDPQAHEAASGPAVGDGFAFLDEPGIDQLPRDAGHTVAWVRPILLAMAEREIGPRNSTWRSTSRRLRCPSSSRDWERLTIMACRRRRGGTAPGVREYRGAPPSSVATSRDADPRRLIWLHTVSNGDKTHTVVSSAISRSFPSSHRSNVMKSMQNFVRATVGAVCLALSGAALADYPAKPVTLVSPYGPGGAADLAARTIAGTAPAYLGQAVLVVNRTGAAGVTGSTTVAKGKPDGYTLLLARVEIAGRGAGHQPQDPLQVGRVHIPRTPGVEPRSSSWSTRIRPSSRSTTSRRRRAAARSRATPRPAWGRSCTWPW